MLPRREVRDGIRVLRLPLWSGRSTTAQRLRQELTYTASPVARRAGATSPRRHRRRLTQLSGAGAGHGRCTHAKSAMGSVAAGCSSGRGHRHWPPQGGAVDPRRRGGLSSPLTPRPIGSLSSPTASLRTFAPKASPIRSSFGSTTRQASRYRQTAIGDRDVDDRLVMTMGNIGHTQNLVHVTRAFQSSPELAEMGARFVLVGDGVAGDDVRAAIATERVQVTGVLDRPQLQSYLRRAALAIVSQHNDGADFNVPSKLMNFMGFGLPVVAAVGASPRSPASCVSPVGLGSSPARIQATLPGWCRRRSGKPRNGILVASMDSRSLRRTSLLPARREVRSGAYALDQASVDGERITVTATELEVLDVKQRAPPHSMQERGLSPTRPLDPSRSAPRGDHVMGGQVAASPAAAIWFS